jgi:hypothetical protein
MAPPAESTEPNIDAIQAERDRLQERVERLEAKPEKRRRTRRILVPMLVVLTVVAFAAAVPGTWTRRTLLDTDRYVAVVGPLAQDPAVQDYLARTITAAVFDGLSVEDRLGAVLTKRDQRLAFLAGPITDAVRGFVQEKVQALVSSDAFAAYWTEANRFVHGQLVAALEGEEGTIATVHGQVVLNLLPIVNQALQQVSSVATELVGREVSLPEVTAEQLPSEVVPQLEAALGVSLPDRFGTIVIYDGDQLAAAQRAVDVFGRAVVLFVLFFLVSAAAAIGLSTRKRRTVVQLSATLAVVLVLERRFAITSANRVVDQAREENRAAARAVVDQVLGSLLTYTAWLLAVALAVLVVALVTGRYPWAVRGRAWARDLGLAAAGSFRQGARPREVVWVATHRDALMLGGAAVAMAILLLADLTIGGFFLVAVLLGGCELLVYRVATAGPKSDLTAEPVGPPNEPEP